MISKSEIITRRGFEIVVWETLFGEISYRSTAYYIIVGTRSIIEADSVDYKLGVF